jgi:iron complex transport system substrate-binding protein
MRKLHLFLLWLSVILPVFMFYLELDAGENPKADVRNQHRIVSLCLPVTEIICQMGLEDRIVGICDGDRPEKVKGKPKVGKPFGILNVESVIALKPDLVFCWGDGKILKEKGLTVYSIHAKDLDGVIKLVKDVADILGEKQKSVVMVAAMSEKINLINEKMIPVKEKPLIYFEVGSIGRTRGSGSLTHELIGKAGGINIAGKEKVSFPLLSNEFIIESNPDIILVEDFGESNERIKTRSGWQNLKAVKNNRIFRCPSYYTNYAPRCLEGLEQFAHWFHPELF